MTTIGKQAMMFIDKDTVNYLIQKYQMDKPKNLKEWAYVPEENSQFDENGDSGE